MALQRSSGPSPFDTAAPAGLRQQRTETADWSSAGDASNPFRRLPAWQTGGQQGSTRNAFNDEFFTKMYDQYDEEQEKQRKNPKYVSDLMLREDYTGIVGWDQTFTDDNPVFGERLRSRGEKERTFRVGDIYEDGRFAGNVYDENSGFTKEEANAFIAPHIFGKDAEKRYKEADGDQDKLEKMIKDFGRDQGKQVEAYITRKPYQDKVDDLLEDWGGWNILDEILITASGAVGGIVAGAAGGVPGMIIGGVAGGIGSFMAQDEARAQLAQSWASTEIMTEDQGGWAGLVHGIGKVGEFGMTRLNVIGNLASGSVDTFTGNIGDSASELRKAAGEGNIAALATTGVTGLVDGLLTASTGVGAVSYAATMGTSAVSTAFNKATQRGEWDETTGSFHEYENIAQGLAGAGASVIDIGQMMLPSLLRRSNALGIGGKKAADSFDDLIPVGGTKNVMTMDRSFTLEKQADNTFKAISEGKAQSFAAWAAPSTAIGRLSVRGQAYADVLKAGRTSVVADDLYKAAIKMETANIPVKLAIVNGFGEAGEEVLQTYLNGVAVGWAPSQNEFLQAGIAGLAMGAGMSLGARVGTISADNRMRDRANGMAQAVGQPGWSRAAWKELSDVEKRQFATANKTSDRQIRDQKADFMADFENDAVTSVVGIAKKEDTAKAYRQKNKPKLEGTADEDMADILPFNRIESPSYHIYHSGQTTMEKLEARSRALVRQVDALTKQIENPERETKENQLDHLESVQAISDALRDLLDNRLAPLYQEFKQTGNEAALLQMNDILEDFWQGRDKTTQSASGWQKRAVELVFSRPPNDNPGSFQMLLPQISVELEVQGNHGSSQISQSFEKVLSHDNDGDRLKHMARYIPDDFSRSKLREGHNHWAPIEGVKGPGQAQVIEGTDEESLGKGAGFLNMAKRSYEDARITAMTFVKSGWDPSEQKIVSQSFDDLVGLLREALGGTVREETFTNFRLMLDKHPGAAKKELYRMLAEDAGKIFALGHHGTRPKKAEKMRPEAVIAPETAVDLWIEDTIQRYFEVWRDGLAIRNNTEFMMSDFTGGARPTPLPGGLRSNRETEAATIGQTNEQRSGGSDAFRSVMALAYGPINSVAVDAAGVKDSSQLRQAIIEWYTNLSRFRPFSALETLDMGGNPVVNEARADLENLVRAYYPDLYNNSRTKDEAMMRVANMPFWNVDESQVETFDFDNHDPDATVGSVLIKAAAARQTKLTPKASIESLDASEAFASTTPARAMTLLMGHVAPENVLATDEAAQLGHFSTLRTLTRDYTQSQTHEERVNWRKRAELHPSYKEPSIDGTVSLYRLFVDTIRESADKELAHGPREGENAGRATGRLANEDRKFHDTVILDIFFNIGSIANRLGLRQMKTSQEVITKLENNGQILSQILDMLPSEMRLMVLQQPDKTSATTIQYPKWFFEMLLQPNAEKAAYVFWDAMLQHDIDMYQNDLAPGNAWVKLYQSLEPADQEAFNRARAEATDVQSFVNLVNREWGFLSAPLMAYRTDTSLFDPASSKNGWQWSAPSAERRQALRDANKYFNDRGTILNDERDQATKNLAYADGLLDALRDPNKYRSPATKAALSALKNRLKQAGVFKRPAMAPGGRREFVYRAVRGLDPSSASKGVAGPGSAQVGDTDVRRDMTSFGSQLDQVFNAILTGNVKDLGFNPQSLMTELRLQTANGATIEWSPLTEEQFLTLFMAEDGAYQNFLFALMNPSVYEENITGRATQQYLFPQDLETLIGTDFYTDLILGTGRNRDETNELFLSYIDSLTDNNLATRMLADAAIAYTTKKEFSGELTDTQYAQIVNNVAEAIRATMSLTDLGTEGVGDSASQGEDLRASINLSSLMKLFPKGSEERAALFPGGNKIQENIEKYEAIVETTRRRYESEPEGQKSLNTTAEYLDALQKLALAKSLDRSKMYGQAQLEALKIDWEDEASSRVTRAALTDYIQIFEAEIATSQTGDDAEMIAFWNMATTDHMDVLKTFGDINTPEGEAANRKAWDKLAKMVALHQTLQKSGFLASATFSSPKTQEWERFDPSYAYLTHGLTSDTFLKVLDQVKQSLPEGTLQPKNVSDVIKTYEETILHKDFHGKWVPDLVVQHNGASRYLDAAAAPQQVAIGGDLLKNVEAATHAAQRSNLHPPAEMARKYSIPLDVLLASQDRALTDKSLVSTGPDGRVHQEPWIAIENGSVITQRYDEDNATWTGNGPVVVIRDRQGREVSRSELGYQGTSVIQNSGKTPDGSPTTIRAITQDGLIDAVLLRIGTLQQGQSATVEFQMFNPADKPADPKWSNNIHFDGTLGQIDDYPSIYAALVAGVDGLVQRLERAALDSIKGSLAIFTQAHPRGFDGKDPADFANLLHDMTKEVMLTPMGENYYFPDNAYRGVYRMVRDRLVVVGRAPDGTKVVLSSEQALTGAMEGLTALKVVELSRETLETLRGSESGSGHPRYMSRAPRTGGYGERWQGSFSPEQLARVPQLGESITSLNDIIASFRVSGLLDAERIKSYKYHTWTADIDARKRRPFEEYDAERQSILDNRARREFKKQDRDATEGVLKAWLNSLKTSGRVDKATVDNMKRDLGAVTPDRKLQLETATQNLASLFNYLTGHNGRAFIVDPRNTLDSSKGYLPSVGEKRGELHNHVAPDMDVTLLVLDGYSGAPGTPEWNRQVAEELHLMKQRGQVIGLTHTTDPRGVDFAREILFKIDGPYKQVNADLAIFVPDKMSDLGRTAKARKNSMGEARVDDVSMYSLGLVSDDGAYATDANGVFLEEESEWLGIQQGYTPEVIPTTGQARFDNPGTASFGQRAKSMLRLLYGKDGVAGAAYLAEQASLGRGEGKALTDEEKAAFAAEMRPLIKKALDNIDENTGRPKIPSEVLPGDLMLSINELGKLSITRWGYDTVLDYRAIAAQDGNGLDGNAYDHMPNTSAVRFFGYDRIPGDKASLRGGIVQSYENDPVYGLRAVFKGNITMHGAKIIDEHGVKTRGVLLPKNKRVPKLMSNLLPAFHRDREDKGLLQPDAMRNAQNAIWLLGWDASRAIANARGYMGAQADGTTWHPDGDDAVRWTEEQWAALTLTQRQSITAQVRSYLQAYKSQVQDPIVDREEQAFAVFRSSDLSDAANAAILREDGQSLASAQLIAKAQRAGIDMDALAVETQYLNATLKYLEGVGNSVEYALGAPGFDQDTNIENRRSLKMPAMLTQFIDQNLALRRYVQQDMQKRMQNNEYGPSNDRNDPTAPGPLRKGWIIKDNWQLQVIRDDGSSDLLTLVAVRGLPTGEDHSERSVHNTEMATQDDASNQQAMFAKLTLGLDIGHAVRDEKLDKLLRADAYAQRVVSESKQGISPEKLTPRTADEQDYRDQVSHKAQGTIIPLHPSKFKGTQGDVRRVTDGYSKILDKLGLVGKNGQNNRIVDSMVRVYFRAFSDPDNPNVDDLDAIAVAEALEQIYAALADYKWPTDRSAMPLLHADMVDLIAQNGTWKPDNKPIQGNRRVALLTSALDTLWDASVKIPAESVRELDGLVLTYEKYFHKGYWPASTNLETIKRLLDPTRTGFNASIDPNTARDLREGNPYEGYEDAVAPDAGNLGEDTGSSTELSRRQRRQRERTEARGGMSPQTAAETNKNGRQLRDRVSFVSGMWRNLHAIRTVVPQLNPWLWVWNPVDQAWRRGPGQIAGLIMGQSTSWAGRAMRSSISNLAGKLDANLESLDPETRQAKVLQAMKDTFGIEQPHISDAANARIPETVKTLMADIAFRQNLNQETKHRPDDPLLTRGDKNRQRAVDFASASQDMFKRGMAPRADIHQYIMGVIEYERINHPNVPVETVLNELIKDPLRYKTKGPVGAHNQAIKTIQNFKGARITALGAAFDRVLMPMAESSNLLVSGPANMVLLLGKFRNFAFSSAKEMMGLQAVDAAGAIFMQALSFKKAAMRAQQGKEVKTPTDYVGRVMETADMADLFIRSGISLSGLMLAGMGFNLLGLGGEDEEERRRKRAQMLAGLGTLYDPRDVANSFLNSDALWLDGLTDTWLGTLAAPLINAYSVPGGEGQPERSPAQMHWTLKFFVSPVMGMAEFLQTGNWIDLADGFADALGSMPLINTNFMWEAFTTSEQMYERAVDGVSTEPGEASDAMSLLIKSVGTLEKALFEFAFINELVSNADTVIRNPWALPELKDDGTIKTDLEGLPEETTLVHDEIDMNPDSPTYGEVVERQDTRSYQEGLIRNFTQNNQTAAFLATLFTGNNFGKAGSFMRGDMVARTKTITKEGLADADAELLVLSVWDPDNKQEVLTREGQERLLDSLHAGTVKATDPAIQGIYITWEQRREISDNLQRKIFVEGIEKLELTPEQAEQRMYDIWNGPSWAPGVTPLYDVVWGAGAFAGENGIPYNETVKYTQLNTTWATGPDGKPWATGVQRSSLPLQSYQGSALGGISGNLGVDEVLNSTDAVMNMNLGMRALTRKDQSAEIPDESDIIEEIKASTKRIADEIQDLSSDLYRNLKDYRGGYRYGSRGGGGGGGGGGRGYANNSLMPFLNGMKNPYLDNIPQIYTNNINVRRANLRRERFSSERGRLNQWQ